MITYLQRAFCKQVHVCSSGRDKGLIVKSVAVILFFKRKEMECQKREERRLNVSLNSITVVHVQR